VFHINRGDHQWRLVEVDQQLVFMLEVIHQLPDAHDPETYHALYLRGRGLLRNSSSGSALPSSAERVTELLQRVHQILASAAPTRAAFIHSILLALLVETRPGYRDLVSDELVSLLPFACATVCSTPHFYLKDDLESFFRNLCNWVEHLHKELNDIQWLLYVPLLDVLASMLSRQPYYMQHYNSVSTLSGYRRSVTEARFEKLLLQLRRLWSFYARVPAPFLNLATILLRVAGSLKCTDTLLLCYCLMRRELFASLLILPP
jgi:hypothetical protein